MRTRGIAARTVPAVAAASIALAAAACGGDPRHYAAETASAVVPPPAVVSTAGGDRLYARCATCHLANGEGVPGVHPPLAGSEWVTAASPAAAIRIVLRGVQGPLVVKGVRYNGVMPAYGTGDPLSDDEIAALLTYVRQAWGNGAPAVTAAEVARERARGGATPVTASELAALP